MSFRRRNEPLTNSARTSNAHVVSPVTPLPGPRVPSAPIATLLRSNQVPPSIALSPFAPIDRHPERERASGVNIKNRYSGNPAVRPSPVTSQPTLSTGCADLDKILGHSGLPLGNTLLLEELGTTEFSLVFLRAFASQGIIHNRLKAENNDGGSSTGGSSSTHVVVVGAPVSWAHDLPGEYKGTTKEQKRAQIVQDSAQVSVANMAEKNLKIAWRYGLLKGVSSPKNESEDQAFSTGVYCTLFDITQRLVPGAGPQEITFVPLAASYTTVVDSVKKIVVQRAAKDELIRIAVPSLLNPSLYPPQCSSPRYIIPLMHSLKAVVASTSATLIAALPLDLYPRECLVTHMLEAILDGVIHLQPFDAQMTALLERGYKNEPAKVQQGLVNILKLPVISMRGMMVITQGEYAFRNGRKRFAIEEWGIPVEDGEEEKKTEF